MDNDHNAPFPPPPGFKWVFCAEFKHYRSKQTIRASDHGKKAFCFLVRQKK